VPASEQGVFSSLYAAYEKAKKERHAEREEQIASWQEVARQYPGLEEAALSMARYVARN